MVTVYVVAKQELFKVAYTLTVYSYDIQKS